MSELVTFLFIHKENFVQIIIPKRYVGLTPLDVPIFLAGPVFGGGDWQTHLIEHFMDVSVNSWSDSFRKRLLPTVKFIVPCKWDDFHPLSTFIAHQYTVIQADDLEGDVFELGQTAWEINFLELTLSKRGLIVFGLFPESKENPRTDGLPYAGDTRGELGRWPTIANVVNRSDSILVGAHPDFLGISVIKKNLLAFSNKCWFDTNYVSVNSPWQLADKLAATLEHSRK